MTTQNEIIKNALERLDKVEDVLQVIRGYLEALLKSEDDS